MATGDLFTVDELATVTWRTSSRSANGGGSNCVEVGVLWRTSSRSGSGGGSNCVEVGARTDGSRVLVRDSKDRTGPVLSFSPAAWTAFTSTLTA